MLNERAKFRADDNKFRYIVIVSGEAFDDNLDVLRFRDIFFGWIILGVGGISY